jgi:hypothetical protein
MLHSDKKTATIATATTPSFDVGVYLFPPAKVEVADAEISVIRDLKSLLECRK